MGRGREGSASRRRTWIGLAAALILIVASAFAAIVAMRAPQTFASSQSPRASDHAKPASSQATAAANQSARISLSKLQMSFEPNLGQSDPAVKFLTRGPGYTLFLTAHEAVLSMHTAAPRNAVAPHSRIARPSSAISKPDQSKVVRIALRGAARTPQIIGVDRMEGRSNYFIGNDPKKWRTDVPNYAKVELKNVYPGIDLIYHGSASGQLEYDFRLAPGADPDAIRLSFRGAGKLALNKQGDLIVSVGASKLVQHAPAIYQESGGARRTIAGGWQLRGVHEAGFRMGAYDRSRATVIDPPLVYSTYLGGSGVCGADSITGSCFGDSGGFFIDSMGNAYISGTAYSADFPTTAGAFQTTNHAAGHNGSNIIVAKLNASGSGLIYSTYLGGSGVCKGTPAICFDDIGGAANVDSSGNVFVVGMAYSTDFPTTAGAFQTTNKAAAIGSTNIFATKLNATGSGLIYSTYLGGSGVCGADGVPNFCAGDIDFGSRVDSSGNAYVAGFVYSTDFPTTPGAFQTVNHGAGNKTANLTVTKLNPAGSALIYSTYLGGSGVCSGMTMVCSNDVGILSDVDSSGNAYLSGQAFSTDFPTTAGAFQTVNHAAGNNTYNGFATKLNAAGSALIYSTYLGGSGVCGVDGQASVCAGDSAAIDSVDSSGNAYVVGESFSTDFPTTPGAFQTVNHGAGNKTSNLTVTKLNAAGSALLYSTYLGGSGVCDAEGVASNCIGDSGGAFVDSSGNAYIAGEAFSTDFPTTPGAFQTTNNAAGNKTYNGFLTKLNPAGSALIYSTYLGGSGVCGADGESILCLGDNVALSFVDSSGNAYLGGEAFSPDFPTTPGAFQTVNHGAANKTANVTVTKLNATGSALIYSSYLGGSGVCGVDGLAGLCEGEAGGVFIAPSGNAYIGGEAFSTDLPTTPGAFQTVNHGAGNKTSNFFLTQLVLAASGATPTATPTATVTTPTATPTATATPTPSPTATATPTSTGSRTATPTSTTTATLTATASATPTPTATLTATPTRTGTPIATPTVTATVTGTPTTTITPSSTPTAMASASPAMNIKASPGATASAGMLTVANNSGAPMVTSQVMVSFGNADLFSSATMTASFGETTLTSTVSPVTGGNSPEQPNLTTFNFNPPLVIPDGQSATFALTVVVTTTPQVTMWRRPVMYASIVPGDGLGGWGGGLLASMLLLSIGTTLVASSRPRRMYFVLVIVLLAMTSQVGCDNGSSGGGSSSSTSSGTPTSTQKAQSVTATNQTTGGGITVSGLPVALSTISVK